MIFGPFFLFASTVNLRCFRVLSGVWFDALVLLSVVTVVHLVYPSCSFSRLQFCLSPQLPKEYLSVLQNRALHQVPPNIYTPKVLTCRHGSCLGFPYPRILCHARRLILRLSSNLDLNPGAVAIKES